MSLRSSVVFVALFVLVSVLLHLSPSEPNLATDAARASVLGIFCVAYMTMDWYLFRRKR